MELSYNVFLEYWKQVLNKVRWIRAATKSRAMIVANKAINK